MNDSLDNHNPTNQKHFVLFKRECNKWIRRFGLLDWRVYYRHEDSVGKARCTIQHLEDRVCIITLSKFWEGIEPTNDEICRTAFHEVCELLLARLYTLSRRRFVGEGEIEEEHHAIIRRLEEAVFMMDKSE